MKGTKIFFRLVAGTLLFSMMGSSQPAISQSYDSVILVVRFSEIHVHTRLDPRHSPTAELYGKVRFPGYDWIQTDVIVGDDIYPGDRWTVSRNIENHNSGSYNIGIEVWDEDGGIRRDDRGLGGSISLSPQSCSYGVFGADGTGDKVGHWGQFIGDVCVVNHRLNGSHLTADVTIEAHFR